MVKEAVSNISAIRRLPFRADWGRLRVYVRLGWLVG